MGECIHAFTIRVPRFVTPDATDKTYPLPLALVHSVDDRHDPRLTGVAIPAAVKWICDLLDSIEPVSAIALVGCSLKVKAETIEPIIIDAMRISEGHAASDFVNWASCSFSYGTESRNDGRRSNSDIWGEEEAFAIEHILHSLTSLGLAYSLKFECTSLHGAVQDDKGIVQVVAIRGDTHEDCRLHYDNHIPHLGTDPVLVIARDRDNLIPTSEEYLRIDETYGKSGLTFLDYQTLITNCRNAVTSNILKKQIDDILKRSSQII